MKLFIEPCINDCFNKRRCVLREIDLTAGSSGVLVLPRCVHTNECVKLVIAAIDLHESEKEKKKSIVNKQGYIHAFTCKCVHEQAGWICMRGFCGWMRRASSVSAYWYSLKVSRAVRVIVFVRARS